MLNRRQLMRVLPLSLLLGGSFQQRSALAKELPEEVVRRMFAVAQRGDWAQLVASMPGDEVSRMRRALEASGDESHREAVEQMMDAIPSEPQPWKELRKLMDELTAIIEDEEGKRSGESVDEDDPLAAARAVLDAGGLPRSAGKSDSDFLIAYLDGFQPFLEELSNNKLSIIGSIQAADDCVHVAYRLSGLFLSLRPSVMTLTYSDLGWSAAGGDQLSAVALVAAAARAVPVVTVRALGELVENGLTHMLCEAECVIEEDCFRPAFCCTWMETDAELREIRSGGTQQLTQRLRHDIRATCRQAIERASERPPS